MTRRKEKIIQCFQVMPMSVSNSPRTYFLLLAPVFRFLSTGTHHKCSHIQRTCYCLGSEFSWLSPQVCEKQIFSDLWGDFAYLQLWTRRTPEIAVPSKLHLAMPLSPDVNTPNRHAENPQASPLLSQEVNLSLTVCSQLSRLSWQHAHLLPQH